MYAYVKQIRLLVGYVHMDLFFFRGEGEVYGIDSTNLGQCPEKISADVWLFHDGSG